MNNYIKKFVNFVFFSVLKQSNSQNLITTKANNGAHITDKMTIKSNNQVEIKMKPAQLQKLLESGVLANTNLHIKLL
jgi:hypothetical protein